jgi:hypothetical protein
LPLAIRSGLRPRYNQGILTMKPAPFFYTTPSTVEEAIALFVEHGDEAKLLAGGQTWLR